MTICKSTNKVQWLTLDWLLMRRLATVSTGWNRRSSRIPELALPRKRAVPDSECFSETAMDGDIGETRKQQVGPCSCAKRKERIFLLQRDVKSKRDPPMKSIHQRTCRSPDWAWWHMPEEGWCRKGEKVAQLKGNNYKFSPHAILHCLLFFFSSSSSNAAASAFR